MFFKNRNQVEELSYRLDLTDTEIEEYYEMDYDELSEYLNILSEEMSIEDILEYKTAGSIILSSLIGLRSRNNAKWHTASALAAFTLLQSKMMNWCTYTPLLRRFGFRTNDEIYTEIALVQFIRGDFDQLEDEIMGELLEEANIDDDEEL